MVSREAPCLSILVLTEDSAKDGHKTVEALAKRMLLLVDVRCRTHRVRFEPTGEAARAAMHGNLWKSTDERNRPKRVILGKAIAEKVIEGADCPGFAFFHFDGDRTWSDRGSSENVEKFDAFVRRYVEPLVAATLRRSGAPEDAVASRMSHLRRLTPFYSIEAWLYQNTAEGRRLCAATCAEHLDTIDRWEHDRGALDEIDRPKEIICLRDRHNYTLASSGFPHEQAFGADKSYAETVMHLLECAALCAAIAGTHDS